MTAHWTELSIKQTPPFIIEMSKMLLLHDQNFGRKLSTLGQKDPLLQHILENLQGQTHKEFLTETKNFRIFELIISCLVSNLSNNEYINRIDGEFTDKVQEFMRVFSHLSFNQNPRLGILYLYLFSNDQNRPNIFCKKIIPLVNPDKMTTKIEEIDIYLFSLWLLTNHLPDKKIINTIDQKTPLSVVIKSCPDSFGSYFYSEMAKYLYSIDELFHFTQKRV